jgi:hypothetical protein
MVDVRGSLHPDRHPPHRQLSAARMRWWVLVFVASSACAEEGWSWKFRDPTTLSIAACPPIVDHVDVAVVRLPWYGGECLGRRSPMVVADLPSNPCNEHFVPVADSYPFVAGSGCFENELTLSFTARTADGYVYSTADAPFSPTGQIELQANLGFFDLAWTLETPAGDPAPCPATPNGFYTYVTTRFGDRFPCSDQHQVGAAVNPGTYDAIEIKLITAVPGDPVGSTRSMASVGATIEVDAITQVPVTLVVPN